ncbi:hypothetical protein PPYR_01081 [Photinus pyralis]|uniref:Ubiquitin-like protease family profile domain-containing protein n=1 Tax=Photinus pyralis TaxID=7054 RepID=A0A1Y1LFY8_PHOPY|nr:sentrin-specific protease 8 [Photinus pyralis]KAB0804111.1 hypothetical protein PPYR_01081 [Photinus pyralis]
MSRRSSNPVVLSFHDSLLRLSDIELLSGHSWLNDSIISFYFEYLEINHFRKDPILLFVQPQVTQCIKLSPSAEVNVFLEPLMSNRCRFIFFALNDNEQTEVSGGSHWSLLVVSRPERMVFHFDSSKGTNCQQAMEFGAKVLRYFGVSSYGFREPLCLQQSNGYDCGIHVLCNAENVADFACRNQQIDGCTALKEEIVQSKRRNMLNLISNLTKG